MRSVQRLSFAVSLMAIAGCTSLPGQFSKQARAQETALDTNMNARFGRMELAVENVAPNTRDKFMAHRRGWGSSIRVTDYDMVGLKMVGEDDCETVVRVAWYRSADNDLRGTSLKQKWHETIKGEWKMTDEVRIEGDVGLIGEATPAPPADAPPAAAARRSQFPTVTLGTQNGGSIEGQNLGVMNVPPAPAAGSAGQPDPSAEAVIK